MGDWIWHFWGAPIFRPEVPKPFKNRYLGTSGRKIGAPQKREFQPRRIQPPICGPLTYWFVIISGESRPAWIGSGINYNYLGKPAPPLEIILSGNLPTKGYKGSWFLNTVTFEIVTFLIQKHFKTVRATVNIGKLI